MQNSMFMLAWDLTSFLTNLNDKLRFWGGLLIVLVGVILIIVGAVKVAMGLGSHGKKQVSWPIIIAMIFVGGAFALGGFSLVFDIAGGGKTTIEELGQTILPMFLMR